MRSRFGNQVMVVTGAARGIGYAVADIAAMDGALVVVCDLREDAVASAVAKIQHRGGTAMGVCGDVSSAADVQRNIAQIIEAYGRIDILVNNAAINSYFPPEKLQQHVWERELAVCLTGTFLWSQAVAVNSMISNRRGSIVNLGSGAALAAMPRCASYVAAKHGVVGLTKALAVDWGQYGIRVNCVCPGLTFTELAKQFAINNPEMGRQRELRIPLGKGAQPEDVAHAVLYLASQDAAAISGTVLNVDGGTIALSSGYTAPRGEA